MDNIKIDSVNDSVLSAESQRSLVQEHVQQQAQVQPVQPQIVISQPRPQPNPQVQKVKKTVSKKAVTLKALPTDTQEVAEAKVSATNYGKKLQCTSKTLIAFGAIGAFFSTIGLFNAGRTVQHLTKAHVDMNHQPGGGSDFHNQPMTRTEFQLIDNMRIISFFTLIASLTLCRLGCKTLQAVKKSSPSFTDLVFKKNLMRIAAIIAMSLISLSYMQDSKHILDLHRQQFNEGAPAHQIQELRMENQISEDEEPEIMEDPEDLESEDAESDDESEPESEDEEETRLAKGRVGRSLEGVKAASEFEDTAKNSRAERSNSSKNEKKGKKSKGSARRKAQRRRSRLSGRKQKKIQQLKKRRGGRKSNKKEKEAQESKLTDEQKAERAKTIAERKAEGKAKKDATKAKFAKWLARLPEEKRAKIEAKIEARKAKWTKLSWKAAGGGEKKQKGGKGKKGGEDRKGKKDGKDRKKQKGGKGGKGRKLRARHGGERWGHGHAQRGPFGPESRGPHGPEFRGPHRPRHGPHGQRPFWGPEPRRPERGHRSEREDDAQSHFTENELEQMIKNFTKKVVYYEQDLQRAKRANNKTEFISDMEQIRIYKAKIEWAEGQLARANYTNDQLEEMIQGFEGKIAGLVKDLEKALEVKNWSQAKKDKTEIRKYQEKIVWCLKQLAGGGDKKFSKEQLLKWISEFQAKIEWFEKDIYKAKEARNAAWVEKDLKFIKIYKEKIEWCKEQLAKDDKYTEAELYKLIGEFKAKIEYLTEDIEKAKQANNTAWIEKDEKMIYTYKEKIEWCYKKLQDLTLESEVEPAPAPQMRRQNSFQNLKARLNFRNEDRAREFRHVSVQSGHGQAQPAWMPTSEDQADGVWQKPVYKDLDIRFRYHHGQRHASPAEHGSKLCRILRMVLIVTAIRHMYMLRQYQLALRTISPKNNNSCSKIDEESVSIAPVTVPIAVSQEDMDKQGFQIVHPPTNYIVCQAPTHMQ